MFRLLDVKLEELDDWNCCGATSYMSVDETQAFELSARNLSLAGAKGGGDLVAPCSACYLVLRKTQDYVAKYPEIRKRVESSLWAAKLPMMDGVKTRHPLEVLYNDIGAKQIKAKTVAQVEGRSGDLLLRLPGDRPYYEVDKPVRQTRMEELLEAARNPHGRLRPEDQVLRRLADRHDSRGRRAPELHPAEGGGAQGRQGAGDHLPLCQFNLDAYQSEIRKREHESIEMPILYFTQVFGWALGGDFRALGCSAASREGPWSNNGSPRRRRSQPMSKLNGDIRIGVYVCHCAPTSGTVDVMEVAKSAADLPRVAVSREYKYMCSDPGQELIQKDIRENGINRIVVASCSPLLHEHTFRVATEKAGINPYFVQMVNIREHDSWVHQDKAAATEKATDLIRAAVLRVASTSPWKKGRCSSIPTFMIVGGGIAGIHAALTLANAGKKVYLVERDPTIGGHMAKFDKTFPTLDCAACILTPKMTAVKAHPNITLWTLSEVSQVEGYVATTR